MHRACIGVVAGAVSSVMLLLSGSRLLVVAIGVLAGVVYAVAYRPARGVYADHIMVAASLGVPLWSLINIIALPLLAGGGPAEGMLEQFPALVGWTLFGVSLGVVTHASRGLVKRLLGAEPEPAVAPRIVRTRICILGGGFAGTTTATELERLFLT